MPASATIRRSCGSCCISWKKPWPSTPPSRLSTGTRTSSKKSSEVSCAFRPILSSLRPRRKPSALSVSTHQQRHALGAFAALAPVAGVLQTTMIRLAFCAVGDEGLGAVQHVVIAVAARGRAHALQVAAGAGFGHRDRADQFAGRHLRQPALPLLLAAVVQDVRRDDAECRPPSKSAQVGACLFDVQDHRIVAEVAAAAAVVLGHRSAEQALRAGLAPGVGAHHAGLAPLGGARHPALAKERGSRCSASIWCSSVIHGEGKFAIMSAPYSCLPRRRASSCWRHLR